MEDETFKNCSNFTDEQIKLVAGLRCGFASLACLVLIIVLVALVIISKAKRTQLCGSVVRRLAIWLTAVTVVYEFVLALSLAYLIPIDEKLCEFDGFMNQYVGSVQLIFALVISFLVFAQTTGDKWACAVKLQELAIRKPLSWTEGGVLFLVFTIPALVGLIPLTTNSYGSTGPWCWIHIREENCTIHTAGLAEQIVLWAIPFLLVAILTIVLFARALWLLCCRDGNGAGLCYSITSLSFLLTTCAMCFLEVATRSYSFHRHDLGAWVAYAISAPIGQVAIPLALLVPLHFHPLCTTSEWENIQ